MFLTIIVIVGITGILYKFMGRFNKPMVLGGILAGAIITNLHLPKEYFDLQSCSGLGDIGIVLFMMLLGLRFDCSIVNEQKSNLLISFSSIAFPFAGGAWFAKYLYTLNSAVNTYIKLPQFALLIGLSMSISAFSLVSLFLSHANLLNRRIAHVALLAAGTDDVIFWLVFAGILVYFQTNNILQISEGIILTIYVLSIIFIFPRIISAIIARIRSTRVMLGFLVVGCFISAIIADAVDLHQIFGGFIFGMLLPRENVFIKQLSGRVEEFTTVLLLPVFFANVGAIADINLMTNMNVFWMAITVTLIAFIGKFLGTFISSKIVGHSTIESAFLASILNIRGVVEVIMMKVAWEVGLISLQVFTVLILMAITTSWIATSLSLTIRRFLIKEKRIDKL